MAYRQRRKNKASSHERYIHLPDGALVNKYGVIIDQKEASDFRRMVENINKKHRRMMEKYGNLEWISGGKPTGLTVNQLQLMGKQNDVIIAKRSVSMHRFKTREEFEKYLENLKIVSAPGYVEKRMESYRESFTDMLHRIYGDKANDIIEHIENMPLPEYMEKVQQVETLQFGFYDSDEDETSPFNPSLDIVREELGMNYIPSDDVYTDDI